MSSRKSPRHQSELELLRARVAELEQSLQAMCGGKVDAEATEVPRPQVFGSQTVEETYRLLAERISEGTASISMEGAILCCNRRLAELVGLRQEDVLRLNIGALVPEAQREHFQELLAHALQGEACGEIQFQRKDESTILVRVCLNAIRDDQLHRIFLIASDLTEQKQAEATIQRQASQYAALLSTTSDGYWRFDRNGRLLDVNDVYCRMSGYSRDELLQMNIADLVVVEKPQDILQHIQLVTKSGFDCFQSKHRGTNGEFFDVEIRASYFRASDNVLAFVRDISPRKRAEQRYRVFFDNVNDAVFVASIVNGRPGQFKEVNAVACDRLGYSRAELLQLTPADIDVPEDFEKIESRTTRGLIEGEPVVFETVQVAKSGKHIPVEISARLFTFDGQPAVLAIARDLTLRKKAEEQVRQSEAKYATLVNNLPDVTWTSSANGQTTYISPNVESVFGYTSQEICERGDELWLGRIHPEDASRIRHAYQELFETDRPFDEEYRIQRKDGEWIWVHDRAFRKYEVAGVLYTDGIFSDVTKRKTAEERVKFLAYYDALTGLPNRALLKDRLAKALAHARRQKDRVALLFLDLDRFKIINDSLGHSFGDMLLQEVAERLKKWAREQDTVARVGGDEFVIVLTSLKDLSGAAVAAERIVKLMTREFVLQDHSLTITCSIGISLFPEHGTEEETLLKSADTAMYSAKEDGRNRFRFFAEEMNAEIVERLTLENSLRAALDQQQLFLVYQPQADLDATRITGVEALLRWRHPELGTVSPEKFIDVAENSGLILPIGEWVLRRACSDARQWYAEGLLSVPVAVNVSAIQFRQEGFSDFVRGVLDETAFPPSLLELEITESLLLSNVDLVFPVLEQLKAMGVRLAIDDFGTGYSSLSYLRQFPVSKLKIDRSFIREVVANPDDAAITIAIIGLAKSLNLKVIAEGVETEAQLAFLRAHRCDEIQGYYFSKPLMASEFAEKLRRTQEHTFQIR